MNHPPSAILTEYLTDDSTKPFTAPVEELDWPLYMTSMPDGDNVEDDCGVVYDTVGEKLDRTMDGVVLFLWGIQIKLRASDYEVGWAKATEVQDLLETLHQQSVTIDTTTYEVESMIESAPVISLGVEPGTKRRYLFTLNYLVSIRQTT